MAWVDNRWLARDERQALIDTTKELVDVLLTQDDLTYDEEQELDENLQLLEKLERVHRSEVDLLYMSMQYFSERYNPGNQGNWEDFDIETVEDAPEFHREICERMDEISQFERNAKDATAAPRGHAKSTYLSKANPLREVCCRLRKYIIIISETPIVAQGNLEWLGNQLKLNKKLREDFGPLLHIKQQMNPRDNNSEFITTEPTEVEGDVKMLTLVQAASTGQRLRGRNWDGVRPSMVVCDDLEDVDTNAATREQREKLKNWFSQTVMPLGGPLGHRTAFIYMGTIVHAESLLNEVIHKRVDFKSRLYKAIIEEPDRMDLWEKCQGIYQDLNLEKEERRDQAVAFYKANKEEMDKGAVVLWEEAQPIFKLMRWKWDNGSRAFNTEYQNTPKDDENQVFVVENFRYFDESDMFDEFGRPYPVDYYGFWDVAQGKSRRADYNAIVTIARHRMTGAVYIVDAWGKKCRDHEAQLVALEKIEEFGHKVFAVETIGQGHDMYMQMRSKLAERRLYSTRLKPIASHNEKNKEKRIENLEPLTESGFLRFQRHHKLLLEQLENFPGASHDDLPDALAGAVDLAGGTKRRRRTYRKKPQGA